MDNASSIKLIKRRVIRGNKHVIKLNLVRLGRRDYTQTTTVSLFIKLYFVFFVGMGPGRAGALPQSHCLFRFALKLPKLHRSNFLFREFPFEARERVVLITRDALNTRYPSFFKFASTAI